MSCASTFLDGVFLVLIKEVVKAIISDNPLKHFNKQVVKKKDCVYPSPSLSPQAQEYELGTLI